jgi:integrase
MWTDVAKDEEGRVRYDTKGRPLRERNGRWGRGKRWLACWTDPNNKEKSATFEKKTDAETHAKAMETDAARGNYIDPGLGKVLIDELLTSLMKSKRVQRSSLGQYEQVDRLHVRPKWGGRQARSVDASAVRDWVNELEADGYGHSTVKVCLEILRGALDLAVEDNAIRVNPARSKTINISPRKSQPIVPWKRDAVQRIIDGHPPRYRMIPTVGISCGPRPNELFALAAEDVDEQKGLLRIERQLKRIKDTDGKWTTVFGLPKYGKTRTTTLSPRLGELLREHMAAFPPVPITLKWENPDGEEYRTYNLIFTWKRRGHDGEMTFIDLGNYTKGVWCPALVNADLLKPARRAEEGRPRFDATGPNKPHAWRHFFASDSLRRLVPITSVSADMGHASTKVTFDVYAHLMPDAHGVSVRASDARLAEFVFSPLTEQ